MIGTCAICGGNLTVDHICPHIEPLMMLEAASLHSKEPRPKPNNHPFIADLVVKDMQERSAIGAKRYGVKLQPHNGRDALIDLYQELLDGANYIRQLIFERDGK